MTFFVGSGLGGKISGFREDLERTKKTTHRSAIRKGQPEGGSKKKKRGGATQQLTAGGNASGEGAPREVKGGRAAILVKL